MVRSTASSSRSRGSGSWRSTRSRSPRRSPCSRCCSGSPRAPSGAAARKRSSARPDLREHAERRLADGQLAELRVDARARVAARLVRLLHLGAAHRERAPDGANRPEPRLAPFRLAEHLDVDLDVVDLLHAADVRVAPRLVRVHEGARAREARTGVDDLVAVDLAAPALHLVLRPQGERGSGDLLWRHTEIVGAVADGRKT